LDHVLFGVIGGVPSQLLQAACSATGWAIVGRHAYDQTGIDPHMIESIKPRASIAAASA
jgi:hypothetical protein